MLLPEVAGARHGGTKRQTRSSGSAGRTGLYVGLGGTWQGCVGEQQEGVASCACHLAAMVAKNIYLLWVAGSASGRLAELGLPGRRARDGI